MSDIAVEVAYALPDRQHIIELRVALGCSAFEAAERSGIATLFEGLELQSAAMGIFGRQLDDPREYAVKEGDRVEIYRPLLIDPKLARRRRAKAGKA